MLGCGLDAAPLSIFLPLECGQVVVATNNLIHEANNFNFISMLYVINRHTTLSLYLKSVASDVSQR